MFSIIRNSLRLSLASLAICGVLLSATLVGCSLDNPQVVNGTPTVTVTWTPPPPPSPTPTQPPPCTLNTTDSYRICVPPRWISSPQNNGLIYHDATGDNAFAVFVGDPFSVPDDAIPQIERILGWTNVQATSLASTRLAGETWSQVEIEGDDAQGNRLTARILVTDHQPKFSSWRNGIFPWERYDRPCLMLLMKS